MSRKVTEMNVEVHAGRESPFDFLSSETNNSEDMLNEKKKSATMLSTLF